MHLQIRQVTNMAAELNFVVVVYPKSVTSETVEKWVTALNRH
jgi:hypothetical protein